MKADRSQAIWMSHLFRTQPNTSWAVNEDRVRSLIQHLSHSQYCSISIMYAYLIFFFFFLVLAYILPKMPVLNNWFDCHGKCSVFICLINAFSVFDKDYILIIFLSFPFCFFGFFLVVSLCCFFSQYLTVKKRSITAVLFMTMKYNNPC